MSRPRRTLVARTLAAVVLSGAAATTAGSAPSLGKHLLMAYLPPEQAVVGTSLAVSYMEELYPVTVGSADSTALFDPSNDRIKS